LLLFSAALLLLASDLTHKQKLLAIRRLPDYYRISDVFDATFEAEKKSNLLKMLIFIHRLIEG